MVKNKNDARYLRSERKLLDSFLCQIRKVRLSIRIGDVSREAGLAASTFYRHHKNLKIMMRRTERKMMKKYRQQLERIHENNGRVGDLVECTVQFIMRQKDVFITAADIEYIGVYRKIAEHLWDYVSLDGNNYGEEAMEKIRQVYCFEVCGILMRWMEKHERDMNECIRDVTLLSRKSAQRLSFMVK